MPRFFNTTNSPVVYNEKGQFVGGGEWLETELTDEVQSLIDRGYFVNLSSEELTEEEQDSADGDTPPKRNTRVVKK